MTKRTCAGGAGSPRFFSILGYDPGMRVLFAALGLLAALCLATDASLAQSRARIFDVELGSPVSDLPADEWVDPACGTDGGPPSIVLDGFEDFARCPVEEGTGLREIWFIYDDEWEYIARAWGDPVEIRSYSANVFYAQPIITSLMVDDAGLVQGYRVITDPRAPVEVRMEASLLYLVFKGLFSQAPWQCVDLPPEEREHPIEGQFIKASCEMVSDRLFVKLEGRHLLKPGQDVREVPRPQSQARGDFESSARLEVYSVDAVRDAPCCRASALP
jgi:hypothetical protein